MSGKHAVTTDDAINDVVEAAIAWQDAIEQVNIGSWADETDIALNRAVKKLLALKGK